MLCSALCLVADEFFGDAPKSARDSLALEETMRSLLLNISLTTLGLEEVRSVTAAEHLRRELLKGRNRQSPPSAPIEFYNIHNSPVFEIGVFVLRRGETMPIHDHPNMTVFTKVVFGELHVKKFQFVDDFDSPKSPGKSAFRCANVVEDTICRADTPAYGSRKSAAAQKTIFKVVPADGPNLHAFTAVSEFAVIIDVMGPPYLLGEREVTYFTKLPFAENPSPDSVAGAHHAACSLFDFEFLAKYAPAAACRPHTPDASNASGSEPDRRRQPTKRKRRLSRSPDARPLHDPPPPPPPPLLDFSALSTDAIVDLVLRDTSPPPAEPLRPRDARYPRDSPPSARALSPPKRAVPPAAAAAAAHAPPPPPHDHQRLIWLKADPSIELDIVERPYPGVPTAHYPRLLASTRRAGRAAGAAVGPDVHPSDPRPTQNAAGLSPRVYEIQKVCKKIIRSAGKILAES